MVNFKTQQIVLFASFIMMLVAIVPSSEATEAQITALYGKVIKGKATDYHPEILSKYKAINIRAFKIGRAHV